MNSINCVERVKDSVHSAKKSRRSGRIPGILYGENLRNIMFEVGELELNREIFQNGEHGVFQVNINGSDHRTIIKEVQREPVNHKIIHIDLEEVSGDKIIQSEVPIHFLGSERVASNGGIVQKEKDVVKVQCKADALPKYINVDISGLTKGRTFKVKDIEIGEEISFIDDLNSVIATITGGNTNEVTIDNDAETPDHNADENE
jgi:large subunit ribosomal protein L25